METASTPKRPGPKPSPERRRAIMEAAGRLFAVQGIKDTTTRQIAAAANTTERTLFKHFGSKDALVILVMEQLTIRVTRSLSYGRIIDERPFTPEEFMQWHHTFLSERAGSAAQSPDDYRLLFRELFGDRALSTKYAAAWLANVFTPMQSHMARMRAAGLLPSPHPDDAVTGAFFALSIGYLVSKFSLREIPASGVSASEITRVVGLFASVCGWPQPTPRTP